MVERRKTSRAQDRNAQICCPERYRQCGGSEGEFGAEEIDSQEKIAKALVAARDPGERRARSEKRRVQTDRPEENRGFAQALRGTQFTSQGRRLSLGALDVDVLYQPRRQGLAENAARPVAARQDRVEAPVREGLNHCHSGARVKRANPESRSYGARFRVRAGARPGMTRNHAARILAMKRSSS
jgi:hypothetical protein